MALFENKGTETKQYVGLLDTEGTLLAFVSPVKGVSPDLLVDALKDKGLNVEIRESKPELTEIKL